MKKLLIAALAFCGASRVFGSDLEDMRERIYLGDYREPLRAVAFGPEKNTAYGVYFDGVLAVWKKGEAPQSFLLQVSPTGASFSRDGSRVLTYSEHAAFVWNTATRKLAATLPFGFRSAVLSPDGTEVIGTPETSTQTIAVNLQTNERVAFAGPFAPEQRSDLAIALKARTGKKIEELPCPDGTVNYLAFHPDGTRLVIGCGWLNQGAIYSWKFRFTDEELKEIQRRLAPASEAKKEDKDGQRAEDRFKLRWGK